MTQMDTIPGEAWIPTEEDLKRLVRVVDELPAASADVKGLTYFLNGQQEGYSKSHVYKCIANPSGTGYVWDDLNAGRYSVGNCKGIKLMMFDDGESFRVIMSWSDPDDLIIGSEKVLWRETRLVYQVGHMPVDMNDGTLVLINTKRDQYSAFGSFGFTFAGDNTRKYYFKLFPVSEDNAVTNDDENGRCAGYNYQLTTDKYPYVQSGDGDGTTESNPYTYDYSTYYKKVFNQETLVASFVQLAYDSTNFTVTTDDTKWYTQPDGSVGHTYYTFKSTQPYYEYSNAFMTWSGISELIKNGKVEDYFPVGSIVTLPYHGDYGEISMEVVDYDTVEAYDAEIKHTMTLQSKYLPLWWDYSGGVVFDTNEKTGVLSPNTTRNQRTRLDAPTAYFRKISNGKTFNFTPRVGTAGENGMATIGSTLHSYNNDHDNQKEDTDYHVFVETVYDELETDLAKTEDGMHYPYTGNGEGVSNWTAGRYYECELPYRTLYRSDAASATTANYRNTLTGVPEYPPSCLPFADGLYPIYIEPMNPSTDSRYSASSAEIVTNLTGNGACEAAVKGWGGGAESGDTWASAKTKYATRNHGPRNNKYSDFFISALKSWDVTSHDLIPLAEPFDSTHNYVVGEFMAYNNIAYQCTEAIAAAASPNTSKFAARWKFFNYDATDIAAFDTNTAYAIGDKVTYTNNGVTSLYRFKSAHAAGAWNAGHCNLIAYVNGTDVSFAVNDAVLYNGQVYKFTAAHNKAAWTVSDVTPLHEGDKTLAYYPDVKYYTFVEPSICRKTTGDTWSTTKVSPFHTYIRYWMRDASEDLHKIFEALKAGTIPSIADTSVISTADGFKITGTNEYDLEKIGRYIFKVPVQDEIYFQNKPYYRLDYTSIAGEEWEDQSDYDWFYEEVTKNSLTYRRRIRKGTGTIGSGIYKGTFTKLTEGADYTVGAPIVPISGNLIPAFCKFTGEGTPTGNYVTGSDGNYYGFSLDGGATFTTSGSGCAYVDTSTNKQVSLAPSNCDTGGVSYDLSGTTARALTRVSDIYEAGTFTQTNFADGTTADVCNFFYFNANSERSAYGNHCWAQSNLRTYLNGPFNTATEYLPPPEKKFIPSRPYYARRGGKLTLLEPVYGRANLSDNLPQSFPYYFEGRCEAFSANSVTTDHYLGENIAEWEQRNNAQVLVKYCGGLPVGCKYDRYNYDRYIKYGLSPVQQYKYDDGVWKEQFDENDVWFHPQPSINNGLGYDRLASMFMSNSVWKGVNGSATLVKSPNQDRNKATPGTTGGNTSNFNSTAGDVSVGSVNPTQTLPRQSFLHGFLDVKYKRTGDTTVVENKKYYFKTVYGNYVPVDGAYSGTKPTNPYACTWYEENPNFLEDYKTAIEFLNVIVPVINCNGSFGTDLGRDMYSRQKRTGGTVNSTTGKVDYNTANNKFCWGGTVCVDKVWLTSTGQIAGGDGANCTTREQFNVTARPNTITGAGYYTALKKWRDAFVADGATSAASMLNKARVKSGFTSGAHGDSGYQDTISGALYWWLRSAGGDGAGDKTGKGGFARPRQEHVWTILGYNRLYGDPLGYCSFEYYDYTRPFVVLSVLSPLITLG